MFKVFKYNPNENTKKNINFEKKNYLLKVHYQDFMIFFTFLLFWISIQFGQIIEDSIAYVIVLSIGIIHGSNDFTILKKQQKNTTSFFKIYGILFISYYFMYCELLNTSFYFFFIFYHIKFLSFWRTAFRR